MSKPSRPSSSGTPGPRSTLLVATKSGGVRLSSADVGWFVLLFAVVAVAYYPSLHGGVLWDDDAHISRLELRTWGGLWRIWFELGATQQYYPLLHSSFWLLARIWGDNYLAYHLVNVVLHATGAFLVMAILRTIGARGATITALIFALHPIEVESVAWMTELKNTLSGVLYLGAGLAYVLFDRTRGRAAYAAAAILFVAALLSKTVTASLPVALLIVFWWERGRLRWREDIAPLLPHLILGVAAGLMTAWVERTFIGARGGEFTFSFIERCLIAGRAWIFYVRSLLWPQDLIFIYPRWNVDETVWWQYLFPAATLAVLGAAWFWRRSNRSPLAALLFFTVTLAPALGFLNVYPFRFSFVADHFQYLGGLGIMALVGGAISMCAEQARQSIGRATDAGTLALVVFPLAALTWQQSGHYADAETLYQQTLRRNPEAWLAHLNLGVLEPHDPAGIARAIEHYETALKIYPDEAQVRNNLGTSWAELGEYAKALQQHETAVRLAPGYAEAYVNVGGDLQHLGRFEDAVSAYRTAVAIKPQLAVAHYNLAVALDALGRDDDAKASVAAALRIEPAHQGAAALLRDLDAASPAKDATAEKSDHKAAEEWITRGHAFLLAGHSAEAVDAFRQGLQLQPASHNAKHGLAMALWHSGKLEEAERLVNETLGTRPDDAASLDLLGSVLQATGKLDEAAVQYQLALKHDAGRNRAEILNNLGVLRARQGRLADAAECFREAVRLRPDYAAARANLARATGARRTE